MLHNPLCCNRLTVWLRRRALGLLALHFTIFGAFATSFAADRADSLPLADPEAPCWSGDFTTDEIDPCAVREQAHDLISRLEPSSVAHLQKVAKGFDLERSLRVQQSLLREDLIWQNRGFTARQIDLMVFVAVALTVERAARVEIELRQSLNDNSEPKQRRRFERVQEYRQQAVDFLDRVSPNLENLREYELKFFF